MAEDKKKQIQRKIDRLNRKYEEVMKRYPHISDSSLSAERETQRLAMKKAILGAERKMREQLPEEEYNNEVEDEINTADNSGRRINEIDGVGEESDGEKLEGDEQEQAQDPV